MAGIWGDRWLPLLLLLGVVYGFNEKAILQRQRELTSEQRAKYEELWAKYGPDYNAYNLMSHEFPCGPLPKSPTVPTSVHQLRPGDVKVVGALGDSLTAGTSIDALTIIGALIQYRGLTWSGGGQMPFQDLITMPNVLRMYNPDLFGFATGNGNEDSPNSHFNVAVSGSTSSDLVNQARELVIRMKNDPRVDFENDWKVVTILSGNNDLCDYCNDRDKYTPDNFRINTAAALDILQAELPRTLVNLVEPLNVEILKELNQGLICIAAHLYACECAAFPADAEAEEEMVLEADQYQVIVNELATSGRFDTKDDFTVVAQPFFNKTYLPRLENNQPDMSYFAPDCFHFSRKGQAAAATALWNNMIEPVHEKSEMWTPGEDIKCPTEEKPFIYTNKNSNQFQSSGFQAKSPGSLTFEESNTGDSQSPGSGMMVGTVVGVSMLVVVAAVVLVAVAKKKYRHASYIRV